MKKVCSVLHRLPTEIPYFIIKKDSSNVSGFKDLKLILIIYVGGLSGYRIIIFYKKCLDEDRLNYYHGLSNSDGYADLSHVLNSTEKDFSDVEDPDIIFFCK